MVLKRHIVLIVNPVAGRGRAKLAAQDLAQRLAERGHQVRIIATALDTAVFRARCQVIPPDARVVCIGGDGTLRYFLDVWRRFECVTLLGMGTANVLDIEFGLGRDLNNLIHLLENGQPFPVYPGQLQGGERFMMMVGYGIDAAVTAAVSQRLKNRFGKWAFLPALIKTLWRYPIQPVQLSVDGEDYRTEFAIVSRVRHYAGRYVVAPQADLRRRRFYILLQRKPGRWAAMVALFNLWRGCASRSASFVSLSATEVSFSQQAEPSNQQKTCNQAFFQIDGDLYGGLVVNCKISSESVGFLAPSTTND